jgi:hydroxymethylpyrimidine/phosphomethylpyrimidine kinase
MRTALTSAGSDSGGGAGIQADLKTFAAHGVFGLSAITAITAQNTRAVLDMLAMPPALVGAQIDAVAGDIDINAVKVGMLGNAAIVEAVVEALTRWRLPHVVVDPVMVSKSGHCLLSPDAVLRVRERLLGLADVVTPNRPEAEALTGLTLRIADDTRDAARRLHDAGARAVVVKGGHFDGETVVNVLYDGHTFFEFNTTRIHTRHTHGTGCTFASAIAARLALGSPLVEAVDAATRYVAGAIEHAVPIGHGHGPINHFWRRPIGR